MLSWLANAWRVPELRRRVLFTAAVLAIYRFGSWIPAPGIDQAARDAPPSGPAIRRGSLEAEVRRRLLCVPGNREGRDGDEASHGSASGVESHGWLLD